MKKVLWRTLWVFALLSILQTQSQAQCFVGPNGDLIGVGGSDDCVNTILTAVPFLRIVPDARSGAMGDAGIAISADPNAMHFNPSKLAFVEQDVAISATYTPWLRALGLNDVYLAYLSGYKQIDEISALGMSLRYFSLGDIAFTDENGMPLGNGRPNEFELAVAYARQLSPKFSGSIGLKYIYSNLAAGQQVNGTTIEAGNAVAADLSFTYKTEIDVGASDADLTIGAAMSNVGTKITYTNSINRDFLPTNLGIGSALDIYLDDYNTLTFTMDVNKLMVPSPIPSQTRDENGDLEPNPEYDTDGNGIADYKEKSVISGMFGSFSDGQDGIREEFRELMFSFGAEYWYDDQFAVRAGYFSEHNTKGGRKYLTLGLGIKYNIFGLNFSYLVPTTNQRNPLDNTLRFSLLFDFGAFELDEES